MDVSTKAQQSYWNAWNGKKREIRVSDTSADQRDVVLEWLTKIDRTDLDLIEVGCGAGWLCPSLTRFGRVTATDFADQALARARSWNPDVMFVEGDFMQLDFPREAFDVIVSLEVLSHVADHDAFVAKLASLLRPGGQLMLATQNRPVLEKHNNVPPPGEGQLRRWFDRTELRQLLSRHLFVREIRTITPRANKGLARLIAGNQTRKIMRLLPGRIIEQALAAEFGWTLMALAEKPAR